MLHSMWHNGVQWLDYGLWLKLKTFRSSMAEADYIIHFCGFIQVLVARLIYSLIQSVFHIKQLQIFQPLEVSRRLELPENYCHVMSTDRSVKITNFIRTIKGWELYLKRTVLICSGVFQMSDVTYHFVSHVLKITLNIPVHSILL